MPGGLDEDVEAIGSCIVACEHGRSQPISNQSHYMRITYHVITRHCSGIRGIDHGHGLDLDAYLVCVHVMSVASCIAHLRACACVSVCLSVVFPRLIPIFMLVKLT